MRARSSWPLIPTLAVSWVAFGQVVSLSGLAIWVIGASLLAALSVSFLADAGRRGWAVATMLVLTGAVPFLARTVGGDSAGPITRSALMSTGVAAAMGLILRTRYPAAVLAAALILLGGACGLGAAGRAPWVVGAWAVAAGVTLAMLGPYTRDDLRARRRLVPFAGLLAITGLVAIAAIGAATPALTTPWTIPGAAAAEGTTTDDAGAPSPPDSSSEPPPSATPTATPSPALTTQPDDPADPGQSPAASTTGTTHEPPPEDQTDPVDGQTVDATFVFLTAVALVLLAVAVVVVVLLATRGVVAWRWRRRRRQLDRGDPRRRIVGAWTWVRLRRLRYGQPLPVAASPDVAVGVGAQEQDASLQAVARLAAQVAYDPSAAPRAEDADRAWTAARDAGRVPTNVTLRQRWAWARVGPRSVERRLATPVDPPARPAHLPTVSSR